MTSAPTVVEAVPESDWTPALLQVYQHLPIGQRLPQVENMLASVQAGKVSLELLLRATRQRKTVGVVLGHVMPGRIAVVWPPQLDAGEADDTAQVLLDHLLDSLNQRDIDLAQAVLPRDRGQARQRLEAAGFRSVSELIYMALPLRRPRHATAPNAFAPHFTLELVGDQFERLGAVIEATYIETLDLPELDGCRKIGDTLQGYKGTGTYRSDWWWIARRGEIDIGCLLLADHPESEQAELIYVGVAPSFRGRGYGSLLTEFAAQVSQQAGRKRLILAVDAGNHPAIKVYEEAGFLSWDRRDVFLRKM